uniref:Uncharacterized protein n=1 Tax=Anguilla anguilla TaxID=7936 RepID=A0A0E9TB09_ANGAN
MHSASHRWRHVSKQSFVQMPTW